MSTNKDEFPLQTKHDPYSALRVSEFRNFIFARFFLTIASLMQAVIVGWQVYELTKDPLSLGLVGLAEVIPSIAVSFIAGHIVDTSVRKHVLLFAYGLLLFCSVSLFFISTDSVGFITANKVTAIYAAIFISGIARGFSMPSAFAFWSQLIPQKIFANAVTWNTCHCRVCLCRARFPDDLSDNCHCNIISNNLIIFHQKKTQAKGSGTSFSLQQADRRSKICIS